MVELLNTRDVAHMYHVTSATVLNWIRAGKLKAYTTPGGHYRVAREDLDAFSRDYGYSPAEGIPTFGLRLLFVSPDEALFARLRDAVRFRWPAAQVEQARTEFEVGWWMARLRPTRLIVHLDVTPPALLEHCKQLAGEAGQGLCLEALPDSPHAGWGEWIDRLGPSTLRPSLRSGLGVRLPTPSGQAPHGAGPPTTLEAGPAAVTVRGARHSPDRQ